MPYGLSPRVPLRQVLTVNLALVRPPFIEFWQLPKNDVLRHYKRLIRICVPNLEFIVLPSLLLLKPAPGARSPTLLGITFHCS